jgi:hypothetical protein
MKYNFVYLVYIDGESETIGQLDGLISTLLLCVLQVRWFATATDHAVTISVACQSFLSLKNFEMEEPSIC